MAPAIGAVDSKLDKIKFIIYYQNRILPTTGEKAQPQPQENMEVNILLTRKILGNVVWTRSRLDNNGTYSQNQLEMILSLALLEGDWSKVEWVTLRLSRTLTLIEREIFFMARLATCNYSLAKHASEVTGIELTQRDIDDSAVLAIALHHDTSSVVNMFERGLISISGIRRLVDTCLEVGLPMHAKMFAESYGRMLTGEEMAQAEAKSEERIKCGATTQP